ncbi:MAG: cyclic nucleotide-binding domain-containing protein [Gammaproteobacteria bacterium]|nr:cyclic nucleotide-binding domain-containing protein [Gammaproteobacteria bacterium]
MRLQSKQLGAKREMSQILDKAEVLERLSGLTTETYSAGETVLATGTSTGKLLILKEGLVEVVKDGVQIEQVDEPGKLFGELSVLLGNPHGADVRTLEPTTFYVTRASTFLHVDPMAALYVAMVLAERVDATNRALVELSKQLEDPSESRGAIAETLETIARAIQYGGPAF